MGSSTGEAREIGSIGRIHPHVAACLTLILVVGCGGGQSRQPIGGDVKDASRDVPKLDAPSETGPDIPRAVIGQTCQTADQCGSGFCFDGVCCATDCSGPCLTCASMARVGQCLPADVGSDPRNDCTKADPSTCGSDGFCDGTGSCEMYVAGVVCQAPACNGQNLTSAGRCDGLGTCSSGQTESCAPFTCDTTGRCKIACSSDADCDSPSTCNAGSCGLKPVGSVCSTDTDCSSGVCAQGVCCSTTCVGTCESCALEASKGACTNVPAGQDPLEQCRIDAGTACGGGGCNGAGACQACTRQPTGTACTADAQCVSGSCQQGICCSTVCAGICQSCAVAGSVGTCVAVPAGQDPLSQCADGGAASCGLDGLCDGHGSCQKYATGTSCKAQSCSGATYQPASSCNGSGTCEAPATLPCAPYVCGAGSCKTSCATSSDCSSSAYACTGKQCALAAMVSVETQTVNASNPQWIYFDVELTNIGATPIPLSRLTLDYWYTWEGTSGVGQVWQCTYASGVMGSCGSVTGTFASVAPARTGADHYFQLGFSTAAGALVAGATVDIGPGFHKDDFSSFSQTGDYSYNGSMVYVANTKVTVYFDGALIYGVEPM